MSPAATYLALGDPVLIAAVDEALAVRVAASRGKGNKLPPGLRYGTDADYSDDKD